MLKCRSRASRLRGLPCGLGGSLLCSDCHERTLLPVTGGVLEGTPKTGRWQRSVALDPGTVRALRAWRKRQVEERMAWGAAWTDSRRVFTRENGTDLHPARVSELFDRLVKQSGLPRVRLHDLRHGHCTLALPAGVHPKVVQERLGHSSVAFTLDRYSHVVPAMQEDAAETVARLVGSTQGQRLRGRTRSRRRGRRRSRP
jgi:integrase